MKLNYFYLFYFATAVIVGRCRSLSSSVVVVVGRCRRRSTLLMSVAAHFIKAKK